MSGLVTECVLSDDDADCERKGCGCAGEFNFQFWQQVWDFLKSKLKAEKFLQNI